MNIQTHNPPRIFNVGRDHDVQISDCGTIFLESDEQVTFLTASGRHYDVAAKTWGFYATPSLNARLKNEGFRSALVRSRVGRFYVMIVEVDKMSQFEAYLMREGNEVAQWLEELE